MTEIDLWKKAWDDLADAKGTHDYVTDLKAAIDAFSDIAGGRQVDVLKLDAGALALHVLSRQSSDPDLIDATANLKIIATAGRIDICEEGRERASYLASVVDKFRWQAQP